MKTSPFTISAEAHSDDYAIQAPFDAAPWFRQASDTEILSLAECGWRGDYAADDVALWSGDRASNPELDALWTYLPAARRIKDVGFECSVNEKEAMKWIQSNRGHLVTTIEAMN